MFVAMLSWLEHISELLENQQQCQQQGPGPLQAGLTGKAISLYKGKGKGKINFPLQREGKGREKGNFNRCSLVHLPALLAALVGHTKLFYSTEEKNGFFVTNVKSYFQLKTILRLIEEIYWREKRFPCDQCQK